MNGPLSKRDQLAIWSERLGLTAMLGSLPKRKLLLVLNYHRIGDAAATPYDPELFSATAEELDAQIGFSKKHVRFVTLEEVVDVVERKSEFSEALGLITFDDGYRDNHDLAFPVLRLHNVQGVFFLPTAFVGTARVPWWDQIAYIVRQSQQRRVHLTYPSEVDFENVQTDRTEMLRKILSIYKTPGVMGERFITAVESAFEVARPGENAERSFLNWEEAADMVAGGMAIGSHTHTHEVLSKLPDDEQYSEAVRSKQILETKLGTPVNVMAYPVGLKSSFSGATKAALKRAGYRAAFSYYGGLNVPGETEAFDIRRCGVGQCHPARFRMQTVMGTVTANYWP